MTGGKIDRLDAALQDAGVPVNAISLTGPASALLTYQPWATPEQVSAGAALLAGFDWSQSAQDAWVVGLFRQSANSQLGTPGGAGHLVRGVVATLIDELNSVRGWLVAFKAQVDLSSSLADLKTRIASLPDMPDRTLSQARAKVVGKVNTGAVDN